MSRRKEVRITRYESEDSKGKKGVVCVAWMHTWTWSGYITSRQVGQPERLPPYRCNEREGTVDKGKLMAQAVAGEAAIVLFTSLDVVPTDRTRVTDWLHASLRQSRAVAAYTYSPPWQSPRSTCTGTNEYTRIYVPRTQPPTCTRARTQHGVYSTHRCARLASCVFPLRRKLTAAVPQVA